MTAARHAASTDSPIRLYLATKNAGKVAAFQAALQDTRWQLLPCPPDLTLPPEIHPDYLGNAVDKAATVARLTGMPAIGDDSGLELLACNRWPGVDTAPQVAAIGGWPSFIDHLADNPAFQADPRVEAVCVLALVLPDQLDNPAPAFTLEERVAGRLIAQARGQHGFGFDPYFIADGQRLTNGELPPEQAVPLTARGRAFTTLAQAMRDSLLPISPRP
ncbi:MAG: non-canonical purine NTP pyrophosphatase [Alphaproteobacteria bacterium]|nr:non-canonical purine NTP pyrophosphatase [Alphaproteobacteria bacterium]